MADKKAGQEMLLLIKLVSFFKKMRHQRDVSQSNFVLVNDLYDVIPYKLCVTWLYKGGDIEITIASGQADVSQRSPYAQFLKKNIQELIKTHSLNDDEKRSKVFEEQSYSKTIVPSVERFSHCQGPQAKDWLSPHNACVFLRDKDGGLTGGVWLERDNAFTKMDQVILDDVGDSFSYGLQFYKKRKGLFLSGSLMNNKFKKVVLVLVIIACLWPVRFSMTVNAEIVSEAVETISVPYNGLIESVLVAPNQSVKEGDSLFSLEKTGLLNGYNLSLQELSTARHKLEKTERETFGDATKRSELRILKEQVKLKQIEVKYAKEKLGASDVLAKSSGMVLFGDKNDLLGQPIQAGQQVMILADPSKIELLLRIPSEGIIDIDKSVDVKFFLNVDPLKSYKAKLYTISYKPSKAPDGLFGYSARAKINNIEAIGRVGLMGTAKVYGGKTILIVNILRRPFLGLRNILSF